MTVGHCAIHLGGWGRDKPPQQFNGRVLVEVQGARHLEAPKNLHLMVPKSRSIIAQQYVDGYAFFHVHCSTKSQANPKGSKFSILKFLIRKRKCVCSIVPAGQYFSNLKGKQFTLLFIILRIVLLSSIQPKAETLDFSTHPLPRNLLNLPTT